MYSNRNHLVDSMMYKVLTLILLTGLVLSPGFPQAVQAAGDLEKNSIIEAQELALAGDTLPGTAPFMDESAILGMSESQAHADLPPDTSDNWWANVQEDIRRSEYQITWQEQTYLSDLEAAYQAPNRAQNLRTYFTPGGISIVPRVFEGDVPPWEWGLTLTGYGYAGYLRPVSPASLDVQEERIEYYRENLTEWYINDERGLEQGFTLEKPPSQGQGDWVMLELSLDGTLTPNLIDDGTAIELTTRGGVRVLRYGELSVYDKGGHPLSAGLDIMESAIYIRVDASTASYPISIDPLVTTPSWTAESDQDNANFGWSVGTAGDVNGDGYSDVIVGAPYYDNGAADEGRAYVYHGSPGGLSISHAWAAESDQIEAMFGWSVGTAGDVNGDGYSDVLLGAPDYDNDHTDEGRVYVYHGGSGGLSIVPIWMAESDQDYAYFGSSVGTAGDVNGDGYSDVIVGSPNYANDQGNEGGAFVYHGSESGLGASPNWTTEGDQEEALFGYSVGPAGDVNADGFSDVIVGALRYDNNQTDEGRAYVYHGGESGLSITPSWTAESDQSSSEYGFSVRMAGDVNGDGYGDVIIGARSYDNGQTSEGRAFVYHGGPAGLNTFPSWTAESDQDIAYFGSSVGVAGDVNGDGYSDVIVGASHYDNGQANEGGAFVYHGGAGGLNNVPSWTAESDQSSTYFGNSVGTAGDVNGDGYSDVIVGAYQYSNGQTNEGRAFVFHGGPGSLSVTPFWMVESDQPSAFFGFSVGTAGDVNGDGYSDVIAGAHSYDNGQTNEGRAYVYHGGPNGLDVTPAWTAESDQNEASFGISVGTAGDVNGDGYSDVVIGAYRHDNGQTDEGRAYVYLGSTAGLSTIPDWMGESDQAEAWYGYSVGTAGDVNGDGYSDVVIGAYSYDNGQTDEGRIFVYHGGSDGLSSAPFWTAESDQVAAFFGFSAGTAGDVNGDGYSDVIAGALSYDNVQVDEGRAFVYHGSPGGLSASPEWTTESDQDGAGFGNSVGTAGDVNGDGYSDVVIGAYSYDNGQTDEGRAFIYYGSAGGLNAFPSWTAESDQDIANFGISVGTAGDVNGDGYSDVIIGAYRFDNSEMNEGGAFVYHGGGGGLNAVHSWTAEGNQIGAFFGGSVGTAGDVNGDGYSEVIVGANAYDNGQTNEGRAFVYYGGDGDGLHMLPRQLRSEGSGIISHLGISDSGTAFQLSLIGRMPLGRELVKLQWQVAPLGATFSDPAVVQGTSVDWSDTGTDGVEINQVVNGLTPQTPYHWRVRLLYRPVNALGQVASRWVHIPWAGWEETDLRTGANLPPLSDAGADQNVGTNATVTLNGSGSSDPDGNYPLSYLWEQTGGPGVTLSDPTAASPTFTAPANPATLSFTLTVTDSIGLADPTPDEMVVTVDMVRVYLPLALK